MAASPSIESTISLNDSTKGLAVEYLLEERFALLERVIIRLLSEHPHRAAILGDIETGISKDHMQRNLNDAQVCQLREALLHLRLRVGP